MGEIKVTYELLEEGASTIEEEKTQVASFDKIILTDLMEDMKSFHSTYADNIYDTVSHMRDTKAEGLASKLGEYAEALITVCEIMRGADEGIADAASEGGNT